MGASVRARLLAIAKQRNQTFDLLLTRYTLERLLYRLSTTKHRDRFVLKGAMLLAAWFNDPHRPTRDVDFLGFGDSSAEAVLGAFKEIFAVELHDGVRFDLAGLRVDLVREALEYGGLRLRTTADVGGARIGVVIDIGFGDAVEPEATDVELPVLLDMPSPRLRAYPREAVIAEKFHALVYLGRANSRMNDFYDIWLLSRSFEFSGDSLARAIAATFTRRKTEIPGERPDALTPAFANDPAKQQQWIAFAAELAAEPVSLAEILEALAIFLMPHVARARELSAHK